MRAKHKEANSNLNAVCTESKKKKKENVIGWVSHHSLKQSRSIYQFLMSKGNVPNANKLKKKKECA